MPRMVKIKLDCDEIQEAQFKLGELAICGNTVGRCKMMHIATKYPNFEYMLINFELVETKIERDFGVLEDYKEVTKKETENTMLSISLCAASF